MAQWTTLVLLDKKGKPYPLTDAPRAYAFSDVINEKFKNFGRYFHALAAAATANLSQAGATFTAKALREAKTEWGKSRIAGNHYGVRFRPEGRGEGRDKSGTMIESLSARLESQPGKAKGAFGWTSQAISENGYIALQEVGFFTDSRFDPSATEASGVAKFSYGNPPKFVQGAASLPKARKELDKIANSFYSGAWNEAVRQWNKDGFTGDIGTYMGQVSARMKQQYARANLGPAPKLPSNPFGTWRD